MMDDWKDRFYDEYDYPDPVDTSCKTCGRWQQCDIEGYEAIGFCHRYDEFMTGDQADDNDCWEE